MSASPLVSVIVPAYNTAPYIGETIDSVLAQTLGDFEIIVVNDGSPDTPQLEAALEPYRERIVYLVRENGGLSAARNTGLREARGRYVAILDSDDRLHRDYLRSQVAILEADPGVDVVWCDAEWFGPAVTDHLSGMTHSRWFALGPDGIRGPGGSPPREITFARVLARDCQIYGEVTARAETLRRAGGYDEALRSAEDLDLWLRILRAGGRVVYNNRVLAYYRSRPDSLSASANAARLRREVLKVLDKVARLPDLTPEEAGVLQDQREALEADLELGAAKVALGRGDGTLALRHLQQIAPAHQSRKIRLLIAALRVAPRLVSLGLRRRLADSGAAPAASQG